METSQVYQIAQLIISVLGFGVLIPYIFSIRRRLNNQSEILEEQNKWLESAKTILQISEPQKVKEIVSFINVLEKEIMQKEKEKETRELNEKLSELTKSETKSLNQLNAALEAAEKELFAAADLALCLLYYVPPYLRKRAIVDAPQSISKVTISKDIEKRAYIGNVTLKVADILVKAVQALTIHNGTQDPKDSAF